MLDAVWNLLLPAPTVFSPHATCALVWSAPPCALIWSAPPPCSSLLASPTLPVPLSHLCTAANMLVSISPLAASYLPLPPYHISPLHRSQHAGGHLPQQPVACPCLAVRLSHLWAAANRLGGMSPPLHLTSAPQPTCWSASPPAAWAAALPGTPQSQRQPLRAAPRWLAKCARRRGPPYAELAAARPRTRRMRPPAWHRLGCSGF